jgi:hypothetical protein
MPYMLDWKDIRRHAEFYLGMEAGWASSENDDDIGNIKVDIDVTFIPIELNLKYVAEIAPLWVVGLGAGISYNYFEIEATISTVMRMTGFSADRFLPSSIIK